MADAAREDGVEYSFHQWRMSYAQYRLEIRPSQEKSQKTEQTPFAGPPASGTVSVHSYDGSDFERTDPPSSFVHWARWTVPVIASRSSARTTSVPDRSSADSSSGTATL